MNKYTLFVFIILTTLIFSNIQVKWFLTNYPPALIINQNNDYNGFEFKTLNLLISNLRKYNYDSSYYTASFLRTLKEMEHKKNVCSLYLFKTPEREEYLYYSLPYRVILPNGVIIKKSEKYKFEKYMDKKGKIKLNELLEDKNLTLGINKKISYSKEIDELIRQHVSSTNLLLLTRENYIENLIKLLDLNRINYFIGYSESIKYLSKKINIKNKLIYIPISKISNKSFSILYIVAPKNQFGKQLINTVNKIILNTDFISKAAKFYEEWLDESSIKEFKKLQKLFLKTYYNEK